MSVPELEAMGAFVARHGGRPVDPDGLDRALQEALEGLPDGPVRDDGEMATSETGRGPATKAPYPARSCYWTRGFALGLGLPQPSQQSFAEC